MSENYESFAAIAVFKELYDQNKDVYDIIAALCIEIIRKNNLTTFTLPEITNLINSTYNFGLKDPIVKTGLKRLKIKRKSGYYTPDISVYEYQEDDIIDIQIRRNEILLNNLYDFIQDRMEYILSAQEKEIVKQQFFEYLVDDESDKEYGNLINQYVLSITMKDEYIDTLKKIKEGLLIYDGIRYSGNINELGRWNTELNIFLEQEILFYIAGFNGEIHKELYWDLLKYIREINHNLPPEKRLIKLWYNQDVKDEIDSYFHAAERIVCNGELMDPSKKPMMYILDSAHSKSDVIQKKIQFFKLLEMNGIKLFKYDYYSSDNYKYSILDEKVYFKAQERIGDKDENIIHKSCSKINCIEILRKGENSGFDNIKYILLTSNGTILKLCRDDLFCKYGDVPKATTIDFLINKFWFKLNKGFGEGNSPKTLDMVAKARVALAFLTNSKVEKIYDEIKEDYKNNKIGKEEAVALIAELRSYSKTPDEVDETTIDEEIDKLSQYEVEKRVNEIKREEIEREHDKKQILKLSNELEQLKRTQEKEREKEEISRERREKELLGFIEESKKHNEELNGIIIELKEREEQRKIQEEIRTKKRKKIIRLVLVILGIIAFSIGLYLVFLLEKSISGIVSIVIGVLFEYKPIVEFVRGEKL